MSLILSVADENAKTYFRSITQENATGNEKEKSSTEFHQKMQNPINHVITFKGSSSALTAISNLSCLRKYFSSQNGDHIFGKTVRKLTFSNTSLRGCHRGGHTQMNDKIFHIALLIRKNPNIEKISLKYASLGNREAMVLLLAVEKNTKLQFVNLKGNSIDSHLLRRIEMRMIINRMKNGNQSKL